MSCSHPGPHYFWVDESNSAITKASARFPLCRRCYEERHRCSPRDFRPPREEDFDRQRDGVLGVHNLLSSGDFVHRDSARARFVILQRD